MIGVKEQVYTIFELSPISCIILLSPSLPSLYISPSNVVLIDKQLSPSLLFTVTTDRLSFPIHSVSVCACLSWFEFPVVSHENHHIAAATTAASVAVLI